MGCGERWPRVTSMNRARRPVSMVLEPPRGSPTDRISLPEDRTLTMALSRVLREFGNEVIHSPWQATGVASLCRNASNPSRPRKRGYRASGRSTFRSAVFLRPLQSSPCGPGPPNLMGVNRVMSTGNT